MTYYAKIHPNAPLFLENSKKSAAIILLSGKVDIYRKCPLEKSKKSRNKKKLSNNQTQGQSEYSFDYITGLVHENDSISGDSQCKIIPLHDKEAQILFVQSVLYDEHIKKLNEQNIQTLFKRLKKFFPEVQKQVLVDLAKEKCIFKHYRMNEIIYRYASVPEAIYLLFQGNVKLERFENSPKNSQQTVILNPMSIFGEKDIKLMQRQQTAVSISAYAHTLVIPKQPFLKFAQQKLSNLIFLTQDPAKLSLPIIKSRRNSVSNFSDKKPKLTAFHSRNKTDSEKLIETKILQNCRGLVDLSPRKRKKSRLDLKRSESKDYSIDQFKQKINLFQKIRPNAKILDFTNPIINVAPKRAMSHKDTLS